MNIEKIKEMLKNKKVIVASSAVISLVVIGAITAGIVHNKNKVEDNKQIVETTKENDNIKENEVKKELEDLNKIDISKLSEEDKNSIEDTKKLIEEMISNKEYDKARRAIDSVKTNIDNKFNEIAEKEKEEVKEESKEEKVEENKEVTTNDTTSNSTSSNTSSNTSGNSGSNSSSNQQVVQQPTTPPVVEEKPVESVPVPTPQPPVIEETKPAYPTVAEVQQRLIAYGQSLGLTYDPSINSGTEGTVMQGTDQMWGNGLGGNADCQTLFNGLVTAECYAFNVEVVDLGNGFCSMKAYGIMNWD